MCLVMAIALAASELALAHAQDHGHRHGHHPTETSASSEAPIKITINPQARVSVSRGGELPPAAACGHAMELPVKIVNQGFVTTSLEASLVDSVPESIGLEFPMEPLKGTREERRILRVTLKKPGLLDITIAFRARNDISDLGGRDRIHLLIRCI